MTTPVNLYDCERLAQQKLSATAWDYYSGGSGDEITVRENHNAYDHVYLRGRVLVGVETRDLSITLLGHRLAMPLIIAPTAFHQMAHPDGELATVRAAATAGTIMTLSTLSTKSVEEVTGAAGGPVWFQLYVNRDRGFTQDLVTRARVAGCSALVVTADAPVSGRRERDIRNGFCLPDGMCAANLSGASASSLAKSGAGMSSGFNWIMDPSISWKDIAWLASIAEIPVFVKGLCRGDDAVRAIEHGAAGVMVSNHGGRQLDTSLPTIRALPEVVQAVAGRVPVLVDGGVRRGTDVLKALAMGASAVQIGRPVLWGLAMDGQRGVELVLEMLRQEFDLAMALAGCRDVASISADLLAS